jgi:predicted ATPase/class 3 adenylate cyclase
MPPELPSGTVTFLFTDVEGSTMALTELGADAYATALAEHRQVIRAACAAHGGVEVDTQGDAFFFAFPTPGGAASSAEGIVDGLGRGPLQVRVGLHTGTPLVTDEGYVGADVHRAARIAAAGHGGQVLVSASSAALLEAELHDLGEHRFKDLAASERVYQLGGGEFPPLKSLYRTNLPVPTTSFLGRERELVAVVDLLARDDVRLLTLTGPGGTGKTRLALQAAAESADEYPDGTWWVPLSSLRDPAMLLVHVAQAVGASDGLDRHIGDKRMLLVLDNLEHLLPVTTEIAALLQASPNLEIVTTSRELLQLQAEHVYVVPPLSDMDGSRLFLLRARAAAGDSVADPALVDELCRRLDNLPLAIELAAARTRHLTPAQLLERLSQRLDLLKGGRDVDPRQQTLRGTIAWSYELLDEAERRLFARLSVFTGGCTLAAAETVCDADLETVASLVDKSLLRKTDDRYWMLATIREFAEERLVKRGEVDELRGKHLRYFAELAPSLGFTVESIEAGAAQRHDVAIAELSNVRAALDWALEHDPVLGLRLAAALENFWVSYSPFEAKRLFEVLTAAAGDVPPDLRALATRCRGNLEVMTGSLEPGLALYEASLRLYDDLGDEHGRAVIQHRIGVNIFREGEREQARKLLEESLATSQEHGFRINELMVMGGLGAFDYREGRVEEGLDRIERGLRIAAEVGFKWWEANLRHSLAAYAFELGRMSAAEEHARAQLVLGAAMSDRRHSVQALGLLAQLAVGRGDKERAARLWGALEAEELRGPVGQRPRMEQWEEERARIEAVVLAGADAAFETARAEGRRMALGEAVEYALV